MVEYGGIQWNSMKMQGKCDWIIQNLSKVVTCTEHPNFYRYKSATMPMWFGLCGSQQDVFS